MIVTVGVATGTRGVWCATPSGGGHPPVLDRVTVNVAASSTAWTGPGPGSTRSAAQPTGFDLAALDAVTLLPNTQSAVRAVTTPPDARFQRGVAGDGPDAAPPGDRPRHRPDRAADTRPSVRSNPTWWSTRTIWPWPSQTAVRRRRQPRASTHQRIWPRPTAAPSDRLPQSRPGAYVDAAGKPLSRADGRRDRATRGSTGVADWIAAQLRAVRDLR